MENLVKMKCLAEHKTIFKLDPLKSENKDLEHKSINEFDRVVKQEKLSECKSEHMYTMAIKKQKLEDELSTASTLCSNICIKKEPPDINEVNMMATPPPYLSENKCQNTNKEYDENIIKPDPTYRAKLYSNDEEEGINSEYIFYNHLPCKEIKLPTNDQKEIENSITNKSFSCYPNKNNISQLDIELNKFDDNTMDISHQNQHYLKCEKVQLEELKDSTSFSIRKMELLGGQRPPNDFLGGQRPLHNPCGGLWPPKKSLDGLWPPKSSINEFDRVLKQEKLEVNKLTIDINQYPDNVNTLLKLSAECSRRGDNNRALKYINLVLIKHPKNMCALINKGTIFANEGDLLSALEIFQKAAKDNPKNTTAKMYYDQTLIEMAQRLTEEENYTEAMQKYQKCNFIYPNDNECKEALTKIQYKRQEMLSALEDIKSKESIDHSTNEETYFALPESEKEFKEIVNTPIEFKSNNEDIITTQNEMLEELTENTTLQFENNNEDIISTRNEMLKELNDSLINESFIQNINEYENLASNTKVDEHFNYNNRDCETETKASYLITQNPSYRRIRLAIIGDSHALRYPHYLFSKQFESYLLRYQPCILDLYDQYGNGVKNSQPLEKMLEVSAKPDAVIIIIGGNDVASTTDKDHKILQALINMTETLHTYHIQPIIIPIIPRNTTIQVSPEVYNIRAYKINIDLQTILYKTLNFNPVIEYVYHMPELECDGVHLTKADYRYLTEKITDHYLKTNYRQHRKG